MTLPPEDRDLIERVLGAATLRTMTLGGFAGVTGAELSRLLAAVRAEAAPVVDEGNARALIEKVTTWPDLPILPRSTVELLMQLRAALEAALNPSPEVGS